MNEFHPLTTKMEGDRVKTPRHPADESRGLYYGTVIHGKRLHDELLIRWDENIPYMPNPSSTLPAILV